MADYRISHPTKVIRGRLQLPGSKSETNRLLILRALYFPELDLEGISDSNDSMLMLRALNSYRFNSKIDVQDEREEVVKKKKGLFGLFGKKETNLDIK